MPETPFPTNAYAPAITQAIYQDLCTRAAAALRSGYSAIIDAVALGSNERAAFASIAASAGVQFTGLWLDAPAATMAQRIGARRMDASDASAEILSLQLRSDPGWIDWRHVDASGTPDAMLLSAKEALRTDDQTKLGG